MLYRVHGYYVRANTLTHARRIGYRAFGLRNIEPVLVSANYVAPNFGDKGYDEAIRTLRDNRSFETSGHRPLVEAQVQKAEQDALVARLRAMMASA